MDAVLDIGNTRIKWGISDGTEWVKTGNASHENLQGLLSQIQQTFAPERLIYSNVSSLETRDITTSLNGVTVLEFTHELKLPIELTYKSPQTLGKDRLIGIVESYELFPRKNALVIDAGTCITYDLRIGKEYLGGNIAPGLQMRLKAMNTFTGKLPLVEVRKTPSRIGNQTESSISSGAYWGMIAEIEGIVHWYSQEFGTMQIIGTGGDWPLFAGALKNSIFADPNLVLNGLRSILKYN